jgi:hypothetical protein
VVILVNLLMKIDRWLGGILVVAGILSYFLKWFSHQASITFFIVGLILILLSVTSDKGRQSKK